MKINQDESYFCQNCDSCIGHGIIIENLIFRHEAICVGCRYNLINSTIHQYQLSPNHYLKLMMKPKYNLSEQDLLFIEKYDENFKHFQIINLFDKASNRWQDTFGYTPGTS